MTDSLRPLFIKHITWAIGAVSVLVSLLFSNEETQFIKPLFHVSLCVFYYVNTKKISVKLVVFLSFAMVAEFLTARDFQSNYALINLLFTCYFLMGTWLLLPVLRVSRLQLKWRDATIAVIFTTLVLYLVYSILYFSIQEFKEQTPSVLAGIAFLSFTGCCIYISIFNPHPKKIYLFIVGTCYFIVCIGYLIFELLVASSFLLGIVNAAEIIAQFYFVVFLIHKKNLLQNKEWFI